MQMREPVIMQTAINENSRQLRIEMSKDGGHLFGLAMWKNCFGMFFFRSYRLLSSGLIWDGFEGVLSTAVICL